jgi:DNA adenine methylase
MRYMKSRAGVSTDVGVTARGRPAGCPVHNSNKEKGLNTATIAPPLKWHGGKHYLASRIIALMPPHIHYVEPFAGGLAVLLAKDPDNVSEVVNDLDGRLINFWRVLRDRETFEQFRRQVECIPFSRQEWRDAEAVPDPSMDSVAAAVGFFVRVRQSLAGRGDAFAPLSKTRTRRRMNEQCSAWLTAIEGLPAVHGRLHRIVIEHRDALELIRSQDGPQTLFYCDPPYLHATRTARKVYGPFEMSEVQHKQLLDALLACHGKVMISGYPSPLYDNALASWTRHCFDLPNNAAGGSSKGRETEVLWCNF